MLFSVQLGVHTIVNVSENRIDEEDARMRGCGGEGRGGEGGMMTFENTSLPVPVTTPSTTYHQ